MSTAEKTLTLPETKNSRVNPSNFSKYLLLIMTVAEALVVGGLNSSFFKVANLLNVLSSACVMGIVGIGITCIFAADELDFGAGTEVAIGACMMAWLCQQPWCKSYILGIVLTLLVLVFVGAVNAFINIKIGIPAFISTMGMSYLCKGLLKGIVGASGVYSSAAWPSCYTFLGQGYLFGVIPMPAVVLVVIAAVMLFYTEKTRSGKYIYAVGVNPGACKYLGISIDKQKLKGFVLCSVLCGIGGIVQGSMLNGGIPTMGDSMFNLALIVLMLGAMFIKLGVFNVPGTIVGSLFIAIMNNGMTMAGASSSAKELIQGGMLILAVCVVTILKHKNK